MEERMNSKNNPPPDLIPYVLSMSDPNTRDSEKLTLMPKLLEKLEEIVLANNRLGPIYTEEKSKLQNSSSPLFSNSSGDVLSCKTVSWYCEEQVVVIFYWKYRLLNESNPHYVLYRAMMTSAKIPSKGDRVQQIFEEAVQLTVEKAPFPNYLNEMEEILYSTLQKKLKVVTVELAVPIE